MVLKKRATFFGTEKPKGFLVPEAMLLGTPKIGRIFVWS